MLGDTGTVNLNDETITGLAGTFYGDAFGWVAGGGRRRRLRGCPAGSNAVAAQRAGLPPPSLAGFVDRGSVFVAAGTIATVLVLLDDRGIPLAGLILVGFCAIGRVHHRRARSSAATSSRSAATPRRRGAPASASGACA